MEPEFLSAVPEIPVRQIDAALDYYVNRLGFRLDWGDEELGLAGISREHCRRFLASEAYRKAYGTTGGVMTWLNFVSNAEVDALFEVWRRNEVLLLSKPESKSWGLHEFTAADPDGNLFRVFHDFANGAGERIE